MLPQEIEDVKAVVERLESYGTRSDGVVLGRINLNDVMDAMVRGGSITVKYLSVQRKGTLREENGILELVSQCVVCGGEFKNLRDFDTSGRSGKFSFTGSYTWVDRWDGNYGIRSESGTVNLRFEVYNEDGYATYYRL